MSPEEIKAALARPAVEFTAGGFRPTYAATESWLGRVYVGRPNIKRKSIRLPKTKRRAPQVLPLRANDGSGSTYLSERNRVGRHWLPVVRIRPNPWRTTYNEQLTTRLLSNGCLKARN